MMDGVTPVRVFVRPIGSALPLGFFSFGVGMLLLGGLGNGWLHPSDQHSVGTILAAFVFPLETLAAIVAFMARDTFGATGLGMFSSSWLTIGLLDMNASQGALSRAVGLYEFGFAFAIVILAVAAMAGKPLIGALLLIASSRAALAGAHEFGGAAWTNTASGWIGVAIFFLAMYGGIAFLLEDTRGETVLPLFRRGTSKTAIEGGLEEQLQALANEAGVRQVL